VAFRRLQAAPACNAQKMGDLRDSILRKPGTFSQTADVTFCDYLLKIGKNLLTSGMSGVNTK
jgi:hypothetical protein